MDKKTKNIIVYSSPDCAYCYTLKSYLKTRGVLYEEIDIYEEETGIEKVKEISGQSTLPVILIDEEIIIGWDKQKLNNSLDLN